NIMHIYWNSEHGTKGNQFIAKMAVTESPVIGSPIVHNAVDILKCLVIVQSWGEPGGGPGGIGPGIQSMVYFFRQVYRPSFHDLHNRAQALYHIDPAHGYGHLAFGDK